MPKARKKSKKRYIWIALALVAVLIVICNVARKGSGTLEVQTDKVKRGDITSSVSGAAKIQPEVQVKISAKVSGNIMKLGVEEGDYVEKGQFLCQLDPEYYQAAMEQAESNYKYAQAGYDKARSDYTRAQELFKQNLYSQAELESDKSVFEQAAAQVEQMAAIRKQAKDNLDKTTLYAPMSGTVSQLNKKEGEMVTGSQFTLDVIMVIADLTKMLAETEIDENDVVSVSVGDTSNINIDAFPDSVFLGTVKEIANTGITQGQGTQEEVTNFLVKVTLLHRPRGLRPGMSATVDIKTETRKAVLKIPIQCVTVREPLKPEAEGEEAPEGEHVSEEHSEPAPPQIAEPGKKKPHYVVFVVREGAAHQAPVTVGISSDSEWEIKEGLEEDEEVVSGSYRVLSKQLKDGDPVEVNNTLKQFGNTGN
jgi:HlyD family secretion protein